MERITEASINRPKSRDTDGPVLTNLPLTKTSLSNCIYFPPFLLCFLPYFSLVYPVPCARLTCQSRSGGHPHLIACQSRLESELLCHVIFHYAFDSSRRSMGQCDLIG